MEVLIWIIVGALLLLSVAHVLSAKTISNTMKIHKKQTEFNDLVIKDSQQMTEFMRLQRKINDDVYERIKRLERTTK